MFAVIKFKSAALSNEHLLTVLRNEEKRSEIAENNILISFWVFAAPESWLKYAISLPDDELKLKFWIILSLKKRQIRYPDGFPITYFLLE